MLFAGWEVHLVKNCDRGLEMHFLFFFPSFQMKKKPHGKKLTQAYTVNVVRDRKIRTLLRTNQIVGFVTVPAWE